MSALIVRTAVIYGLNGYKLNFVTWVLKNLNEKFTDEEYAELMRLKNYIGLSWHDLLLKVFRAGEITATEMLVVQGHSREEIEEAFSGK